MTRPGSTMTEPDPVGMAFDAIGTTAEVLVTEPARLDEAGALLRGELDLLDRACSRFRADSEISGLAAGAWQPVSPLLGETLAVALRAAELTDGLVDPTIGTALVTLGYDRDFAAVPRDSAAPAAPTGPAPGWWRVLLDRQGRQVLVPRGVVVDLGATAKALAADRAAALIAASCHCGVLVSLGGDVAVAGDPPAGGWRVGLGDDHTSSAPGDPVVTIVSGGLATSSITRRTWRRAGRTVHHIVDPRTGLPAEPFWRTVTVAAGNCTDANTASTAAILLGGDAPQWLAQRRLPARLVDVAGRITLAAGWPTGGNDVAGARWDRSRNGGAVVTRHVAGGER